eukprot:120223-Chlamydomonas_euryale.AAC.1
MDLGGRVGVGDSWGASSSVSQQQALEESYPMDLGGETGVGDSWGASSTVSQQSIDCYIEPPASVKNKKLAKHISLAE